MKFKKQRKKWRLYSSNEWVHYQICVRNTYAPRRSVWIVFRILILCIFLLPLYSFDGMNVRPRENWKFPWMAGLKFVTKISSSISQSSNLFECHRENKESSEAWNRRLSSMVSLCPYETMTVRWITCWTEGRASENLSTEME